MAESGIDLAFAVDLPPEKAIAYFRAKGRRVSFDWHSMWAEAHATAFTVANCAKLDVLRDIQLGLRKALKEGKSERWFIDTLEPVLRRKGWWGKREEINPDTGEVVTIAQGSPSRLRLIFRQNMQAAYNAGRWQEQWANREAQPYLRYVAVLDMRTRPGHAAMNDRVFPVDDPVWSVWYPPNDWGCRCRVDGVSEARLRRRGWKAETSEGRVVTRDIDVRDRRTGEIARHTVTGYEYAKGKVAWIGAGFDYNAGAVAMADKVLRQHMAGLTSPALYEEVRQAINNAPARHEGFAATVRQWQEDKARRGRSAVLGVMDWRDMVAARGKGASPTGLVVLTDERLSHADRPLHHAKGTAVPPDVYPDLARAFAAPEAVYWDEVHGNLLYVFTDNDPAWCRIMPVHMPSGNKRAMKKQGKHDGVATVYRTERRKLRAGRELINIR